MKNLFKFFPVYLMSIVMISSCEEDWEPFHWTYANESPENVIVQKFVAPGATDNVVLQFNVNASKEGGTVIFKCENYDRLYLELGVGQILTNGYEDNDKKVTVDGNKMSVTFKELTEDIDRQSNILTVKTYENNHPMTFFTLGYTSDNPQFTD